MAKRMILAAALAAGLCAWAQDGVKWLETVHDFGAFSEDMNSVSTQFKMVNDTSEPITIIQVASTCGCTVPEYDTGDIMPGDTASISVTYNAVGRPGRFTKSVYVRTSDTHERRKLTIKGVVIGSAGTISQRYPAEMGPLKLHAGLAMLGRAYAQGGKSAIIEAYNQSTDTLRPVFENVPKYLKASIEPAAVPPGDLAVLSVYFRGNGGKMWGALADSLQVVPVPGGPAYWLPVTAIIEEDFSKLTNADRDRAPKLAIIGDRIDLGDVPSGGGKPVKGGIELLNQGKETLKIRRVYSQDPAIEVSVSTDAIKKGKKARIEVVFDPAKQPKGIVNSNVTIITNDPSQPTRTIRVVGLR